MAANPAQLQQLYVTLVTADPKKIEPLRDALLDMDRWTNDASQVNAAVRHLIPKMTLSYSQIAALRHLLLEPDFAAISQFGADDRENEARCRAYEPLFSKPQELKRLQQLALDYVKGGSLEFVQELLPRLTPAQRAPANRGRCIEAFASMFARDIEFLNLAPYNVNLDMW